jgi:hypothetical protein
MFRSAGQRLRGCDRPMTEEEWIRERATVVDAEATPLIEDSSLGPPGVRSKTERSV